MLVRLCSIRVQGLASSGCPCRFTLRPGALPAEARLGSELGLLHHRSRLLERRGCLGTHDADHADVLVQIKGKLFRCLQSPVSSCLSHSAKAAHSALPDHVPTDAVGLPLSSGGPVITVIQHQVERSDSKCATCSFRASQEVMPGRCHRCIIAARSEFFRALLEHPSAHQQPQKQAPASAGEAALPVVSVEDVEAAPFEVILQFMYTDRVDGLPAQFLEAHAASELFDGADRLLLLSMKVSLMSTLPPSKLIAS